MSVEVSFESLPDEIILYIISFVTEPQEFYCWNLLCKRSSIICKDQGLMALIRLRFTIIRAWLCSNKEVIDVTTYHGDILTVERYILNKEYKNAYVLSAVYNIKNNQLHGSVTEYSWMWCYAQKQRHLKFYLDEGIHLWLYKSSCVLARKQYEEGIPHGWWRFNFFKGSEGVESVLKWFEVLYDHQQYPTPIAYRNRQISLNIINGKINFSFGKTMKGRKEYIMCFQGRIIDMCIRIKGVVKRINGSENIVTYNDLVFFRSWLQIDKHAGIPIEVNLNNNGRIHATFKPFFHRDEPVEVNSINIADRRKEGWTKLTEGKGVHKLWSG